MKRRFCIFVFTWFGYVRLSFSNFFGFLNPTSCLICYNWKLKNDPFNRFKRVWSCGCASFSGNRQSFHPGRGLVVNFRKKCGEMRWKKNNFHRVFLTSFCGECGESRWIIFFHRVLSILTKKNRPYTGSNLCPPACLPILIPLLQLSLTCLLILVNLNQIE